MLRQFLVCAASLICLLSGETRAQQALTDEQAKALLVGRSVLFSDYSIAKYDAGGAYTYVAANNLLFRGKYTIANGRLCLNLDNGTARCDTLHEDRFGVFMQTESGVQLRFSPTLIPLPRYAAKLCDVAVAYNIYPPAAGVPDNVRAFSGLWTGKWDYGLCAALIVESVQANGTASLIYINGSLGGERSIKPGATRFIGKIDGNKLTNGLKDYYTEYVLSAPNALQGLYSIPRSRAHGQFSRQSTSN